jgi:hypothetical protein
MLQTRATECFFPYAFRYFDPTKGMENKLLGVAEGADETAISISEMLLEKLEAFHLNPKYSSVYSADNANVNFGKYHSVFQLLGPSNPILLKLIVITIYCIMP